MSPIGGFLPLEIGRCGEPHHAGAVALSSGRACWHLILRSCRPSRVRLPFYICDAMLQPLVATRTPFDFYHLDAGFLPILDSPLSDGELLVVVNYFGMQVSQVEQQRSVHGHQVVIDDTQGYFRRGGRDAWSFNSARKFFGVPDGAFLYGPVSGSESLPPSDSADCDHLLTRLAGDDEHAWQQFKNHESRIGIEPRAMSNISARLLAAVDWADARRRRASNFAVLHQRLGRWNTIALPLDDSGDGPMCYPFLPESAADRSALRAAGVFVPVLWPELQSREAAGFEWERNVAARLLPLPIDHRYGPSEMQTVTDAVVQVLA